MNAFGYHTLRDVLMRAFDQAAVGKGDQRHANNLPFHKQPMQTIAEKHGIGFLLGQADKKLLEAHGMVKRGEIDKAIHELLGAINYIAGAIIFVEAHSNANEQAKQKAREATAQSPKEAESPPADVSYGGTANEPNESGEECNCAVCQLRRLTGAESVTFVSDGTLTREEQEEAVQTIVDEITKSFSTQTRH